MVRPQLLIFDDILKDEILTSELARKNLRTWFYSTVQNSIDIEHYKKVIVGTPMHNDDILMNMSRSPEYKTIMFPVADKFPVPEDQIISSWKDRFTPKRIMNLFREAKGAGAEADFYREMMLEVVNDDMRIFEEKWFKRYQYKEFKSQLGKCNIFTTMDLAVSQKKSGDFTVIITIAVTEEGHWFIVKIDCGRFSPSETIDRLFNHVTSFKPLFTKAEKAALQQVLDHYIQDRMISTGTYFNYEPLVNNSIISKELRINSLQPKMKMGHIHFPTDIDHDAIAELEYEMKGYIRTGPTTAHDDAVDCLANFLDPDFIITPNAKSGTEVEGDMFDFDFDDDMGSSYNL